MSAREISLDVWNAGIKAVRAESLVRGNVELSQNGVSICNAEYSFDKVGKICVVGAGKAAGYLAAEMEDVLRRVAETIGLHGFVNVPQNCLIPTTHIQLHAGRPANVNEPRPEGVDGAKRILELVSSLDRNDLCFCLLTGGGSALLPMPAQGVSLEDKQAVTRLLSAKGASIQQLNRVRTSMSLIKGGGLARACTAGKLVTLIVSDVIGDPLDLIASGPTIGIEPDAQASLDTLRQFATESDLPERVWSHFRAMSASTRPVVSTECEVTHHVLANNASAVNAAAEYARQMGLSVQILPPEPSNATAEDVAQQLLDHFKLPNSNTQPSCLIWGGEPVVRLAAPHLRGLGGRNQQLVLAALSKWDTLPSEIADRLCILSGGSDGEDGPTDAAGAFVDLAVVSEMEQKGMDAADYLNRNDAYTFFDTLGALFRTGPTHTNVCDLRIGLLP